MRIIASLCLALSAASASAAMNLEATRLQLDKTQYAPADPATLILTYEPTGSATTLRDVRVEVEIRTSPVTRVAFRIREIVVPQGEREFHMPLDLSKMGLREGSYAVTAEIDGNDAFAETREDDNSAVATLRVATRPAATAPAGSTGATTTPRAGSQSAQPTSTRVVAQTTCSQFEREWSAPLEVGWHPGYGQAQLVLDFDHPMTMARSNETVRRAALRLVGAAMGRPFSELGPMQALVRTRGTSSARCAALPDIKLSQTDFDGDVEIDLMRAMRDAETVPYDCAQDLQVILSFPEARTALAAGSLIQLAPRGASLEVEVGR